MIVHFRNKRLERFFQKGTTKGINPSHVKRIRLILGLLNTAKKPQEMNLPGLRLHPLKAEYKGFWSVEVSGNWRVVFRFEDENVYDVDYLDYH